MSISSGGFVSGFDVLLLGCEGTGKTLFLRHICKETPEEVSVYTIPTNGIESKEVTINSRKVNIREVGGGDFITLWPKYYAESKSYLIDMGNPSQLSMSTIELMNLLTDSRLTNTPFLILLNKMDLPAPIPRQDFDLLSRLPQIIRHASQSIKIEEISCWTLDPQKFKVILDWILQSVENHILK